MENLPELEDHFLSWETWQQSLWPFLQTDDDSKVKLEHRLCALLGLCEFLINSLGSHCLQVIAAASAARVPQEWPKPTAVCPVP